MNDLVVFFESIDKAADKALGTLRRCVDSDQPEGALWYRHIGSDSD
jgi:hypothetical protein